MKDLTKKKKADKILKVLLNFNHCGISDCVAYHVWNLIIIFDSLGKYLVYNTDFFGHYTLRKGLLSFYSVVYPAIVIAILYVYAFFAGTEQAFVMIWVYKVQWITLWAAIICYFIDASLFVYDKHLFCKLQLEPPKTCNERNEAFLMTIAIFYVFWVPTWIAACFSMKRYIRELATKGTERLGRMLTTTPYEMRNLAQPV